MKNSRRIISFFSFVLVMLVVFSLGASATEETTQPEIQQDRDKVITLTVSNKKDDMKLSWDKVEGASFYAVFRRAKGEAKKTLIAKVTETIYNDAQVTPGTYYGYRVVPVFNETELGKNSNDVLLYRLAPPSITEVKSVKEGISLEWTKTQGAQGYGIFRLAEGETNWKRIGKTNMNTFSFVDKTAESTKEYTYAVKGFAESYYSYQSELEQAHFLSAPRISKTAMNDGNIGIAWTKTPKAEQYIIYRATSQAKNYKVYARVPATQLKFIDTDVKSGVFYGYVVRAVDSEKQLGAYNEATVVRYLAKPELKSYSNTTNGIKLTWTKSAGAERYAIYRSDAGKANWKLIGTVKGQSTLTVTDKTVKNGGSYIYIVRAVHNKVQSAYYPEGIAARFLAAPTNVKVESKGSKGNNISFTANKYAEKYFIYRKAPGESWKTLGSTKKISVLDQTAKEGTIYSYAVRAYISPDCLSAASEVVKSNGIDPNGKMVALTYDDGPSNEVTNDILDVLQKYGAKATFFVIGQRINGAYQPMQRAVKMGCEIGNHTYSHIDLPSSSSSEIREEIELTDSLVKKYTGIAPKIARAPGGSTDSWSREIVGKPFLYWSVDTRDWESRDAYSVIEIVKDEVQDGSIILMHDIYDSTAEASETVIPWLINQGYQLVTVSELMYYRGITMQSGVTYYNAYR